MEAVRSAIYNRILRARLDLISEYGLDMVMEYADNITDHVGEVEEIGTSDVSIWVNHVEQGLKKIPKK